MLVSFLDCETNGMPDDPKALPVEVAVVTVDMTARRVVSAFSETVNFFKQEDGGVTMGPELTAVHGMTAEFVWKHGVDRQTTFLGRLGFVMSFSNAICASNGLAFDRGMIARLFSPSPMPDVPWIDDFVDLQYPAHIKGKNLGHKAADHGFLNPFSHSALGDAMTLAYIMLRGGYDLAAALESAKSPLVFVEAKVSFEDKDKAKLAGFRWRPEKKQWYKVMREKRVLELVPTWNFQTQSKPITDSEYAAILAEGRK